MFDHSIQVHGYEFAEERERIAVLSDEFHKRSAVLNTVVTVTSSKHAINRAAISGGKSRAVLIGNLQNSPGHQSGG